VHDDEAKERAHPLFHPRFRRFAFAFSLPLSRFCSRCLALTCFLSCLRARSLALNLSISHPLFQMALCSLLLALSHPPPGSNPPSSTTVVSSPSSSPCVSSSIPSPFLELPRVGGLVPSPRSRSSTNCRI